MKVRELIELNQMIVDIQIEVRINGTRLLDALNIGCHDGVKPHWATKVPISEEYINSFNVLDQNHYRDATYIPKSINAWDDGRDYYQVKPQRIPQKWLDLEVYSWDSCPASTINTTNPRRGGMHKNVNFHGEKVKIVALPSGESLAVAETTEEHNITQAKHDDQLEGQINLMDYLSEPYEESEE